MKNFIYELKLFLLCGHTIKGKINRPLVNNRGGGTYLKILGARKFLSQTWSGEYLKMEFF